MAGGAGAPGNGNAGTPPTALGGAPNGGNASPNGTGGSGGANTGGGGGAGAYSAYAGFTAGGNGGSGIVIIRYPANTAPPASVTGGPQVYYNSGYQIYVFTSSGTITF